jgi:WD40 repeat protein
MTDAFISYSRKDRQFVEKLYQALSQEKGDIWVDWEDIPPTAEWRKEIGEGIEGADNVIFVISPDFVASSECDKELEHAIKNNKRLVPIVCREVEVNSVRLELSKLNWIFIRESDDFEGSLQCLKKALETDLDHVKEHTRLLRRAIEWNQKKSDPSYLLRERSLKEAQQWLAQSKERVPKPTQLHNDYIIHSIEQRRKVGKRRTWVATALAAGFALLGLYAQWEREIAEIAEIQALTDFSEVSLLKDQQLEALTASMLAAKKWQELKTPLMDLKALMASMLAAKKPQEPKTLVTEIENALRDAVYDIEEFNRLEEHEKEVYSVIFSPNPDNPLIASASADGTVKVWDKKGKLRQNLTHKKTVWRVSFSSNGKLIASASEEGTVKLWKGDEKGRNWNLQTTLHHSVPVRAVALPTSLLCSEQVIASAGTDGHVRLWNGEGMLQKAFKAHESQINALKFSPNCQTVASAGKDGAVKLWGLDGKLQRTLQDNNLKAHEDTVWEVDFSPDGKRIATASSDATVKLWNLEDPNSKPQTLSGHSNWVKTVAFSPDGKLIVSGSEDDTVRIWRSDDGSLLQIFRGHRAGVNSISFFFDGQLMASASGEKIRLWQLGGIVTTTFHGHKSAVKGVSFQPPNQQKPKNKPKQRLIASVSGKEIMLWKISNHDKENKPKNWVMPEKIIVSEAALRNVGFTPDGHNLVTSSYDGTLQLWNILDNLTSQKDNSFPLKKGVGHNSIVNNLSISPDGQMLASASADGGVKLWNIKEMKLIKDFRDPKLPLEKAHKFEVQDVSFSPDFQFQRIVSVGSDGLGKIWNINDGTLFQSLKGHQAQINAVAFSHDGNLIATASSDQTIILWKLDRKKEKFDKFQTLQGYEGHKDWVWDVTFSTPEKIKNYQMIIASAGRDDTVKLWGLKDKNSTGKFEFITTLRGHKDWVRAVSFSHDGEKLVSASADKTIILWDIEKILDIETKEKEPVLDSLLSKGCQWLSQYLNTHNEQGRQELQDLCSARQTED